MRRAGEHPDLALVASLVALLLLALLVVSPTAASASDFVVAVEGDSLAIDVRPLLGPGVLPGFVRERLDRGIPTTIGLQADLWKHRSTWFDEQVSRTIRHYRLSRDAWSGLYLLEGPDGTVGGDSMGAIIRLLSEEPIVLDVDRKTASKGGRYWVEVTAVTVPLSVQDLGEVEEWITGEIGGGSGSIFGVPGSLIRIIRDLTGLGDRRLSGKTNEFTMSLVAGDVVWVQPRD
ncbi:MAG: DUF4390 domain-containing protein [Candidatus Eisenbacteria bacterium]|uniref:DUF4390 domain-containing protein n=1 Tax=Eiseniibacteriota bacterium TaxID=2212470 RepID=A0A956N8H9_UNCEI|nr:DUF4390 domain-containing protein [Candidatus Eisenbacteria bacterium]MCB9465054.1 DUF4390 domain-containing protein [Candidatus Eisenbacteria bacterium]